MKMGIILVVASLLVFGCIASQANKQYENNINNVNIEFSPAKATMSCSSELSDCWFPLSLKNLGQKITIIRFNDPQRQLDSRFNIAIFTSDGNVPIEGEINPAESINNYKVKIWPKSFDKMAPGLYNTYLTFSVQTPDKQKVGEISYPIELHIE